MLENRNLRLDLCALALLAVVVFLAVALISYDPADPVDQVTAPLGGWYPRDVLVYPQNEQVRNACGRWGAVVADGLMRLIGVGAYYLVFSLSVVNVLLLRRRTIDGPVVRSIGWLASLAGLTTLSTMLGHGWHGPVIGSGGYLGTLIGGLLEINFAAAGGFILVLSLIVGGLLLCTDYTLLHMARRAFGAVVAGMIWHQKRRAGTSSGESDEEEWEEEEQWEEEEEVDDDAEVVSVRIRGKHVDQDAEDDEPAEDEDEALEDEYADDEVEETEEAAAEVEADEQDDEPPVKKMKRRVDRPATPLRVRKPPEKSERDEVMEQLDEASVTADAANYELPSLDMLVEGDDVCYDEQTKEVRRKAKILEKTFTDFGFKVKVVEIETGPVIAQYEVQLEAGLRLSRITGLADDLAIALRVPSVRIVAPIPGKNTVGIEVPNEARQVVRLREVIEESSSRIKKMRIPLFLGKDVSGNPLVADLSTLPHLLIAGRTGTGKSVCLNAIISSILMTRRPDEVRMLMIDPKMVELSGYGRLPHLMHPVVTDMRKAEAILAWAVEKMEERYALLAKAGVRHISSYNQLGEAELMDRLEPETEEDREAIPQHLPFIVIVADEIADLMMTAGKEVEQHIIRLAQKSRAVGIHLILATQKPTVDVITGLIKSNLPARISFQVASRTDSRVVLDEMGADKLLGNGDMLFLWPGTSTLLRGQGTYLGDDEINAVVDCVSTGEQNFVNELVNIKVEDPEASDAPGALKKRDDLYESAVDVVVREGRGSVSLLQRTLGIGYGRAARLIDFMAEDGIVGEYAGSQAREVTISVSDWERMQGLEPEDEPDPTPPKRTNKIRPESSSDDESDPPREERSSPPEKQRAALQLAAPPQEDAPWEDDARADEAEEKEEEDDEDEYEEYEEDEYEEDEYEEVEYEEDEDEEEEQQPTKPAVAKGKKQQKVEVEAEDEYEEEDEEEDDEEYEDEAAEYDEDEYEEDADEADEAAAEYAEDEYDEDEYEEEEDEYEEDEYEEEDEPVAKPKKSVARKSSKEDADDLWDEPEERYSESA